MADEWFAQDARLDGFAGEMKRVFRSAGSIEARLAQARPLFRELLLVDGWLPTEFQRGDEKSGMGGGIGTWLLFCSEERDLALFSLVVEHGSETPVHDHLAWGLVGLYRGRQAENVYRRRPDSDALDLVEQRTLERGDIYDLIPPEGDIHSVSTVSTEPSISIHLLGSDIGCIWRHRFDVAAGTVHDFRSGYSNRGCADEQPPA